MPYRTPYTPENRQCGPMLGNWSVRVFFVTLGLYGLFIAGIIFMPR